VSPPRNIETAFVEISDKGKTRFASAISTQLKAGMEVRTDSEALNHYRRIYFQALLKDHYGDCTAPCVLRCPAHIDIQKYLYHAASGTSAWPWRPSRKRTPCPRSAAGCAPTPCEAECRRNALEGPREHQRGEAFVSAWDRRQAEPYRPDCLPESGKRVAVVGAGPGRAHRGLVSAPSRP
jgi:formate dehydrogenase major subunit